MEPACSIQHLIVLIYRHILWPMHTKNFNTSLSKICFKVVQKQCLHHIQCFPTIKCPTQQLACGQLVKSCPTWLIKGHVRCNSYNYLTNIRFCSFLYFSARGRHVHDTMTPTLPVVFCCCHRKNWLHSAADSKHISIFHPIIILPQMQWKDKHNEQIHYHQTARGWHLRLSHPRSQSRVRRASCHKEVSIWTIVCVCNLI